MLLAEPASSDDCTTGAVRVLTSAHVCMQPQAAGPAQNGAGPIAASDSMSAVGELPVDEWVQQEDDEAAAPAASDSTAAPDGLVAKYNAALHLLQTATATPEVAGLNPHCCPGPGMLERHWTALGSLRYSGNAEGQDQDHLHPVFCWVPSGAERVAKRGASGGAARV